jgi:PncC family amidohydrolase
MYNFHMDKIIEVQLGEALLQRSWSIAFAESCTGGLIGHRMTNVPGSSEYYLGSVTAYANNAKAALLNVSPKTIEEFGAVSEETVLEMAAGIRSALAADIGISVSGIAGPGGGSAEKPVGLVWIGMATSEVSSAQKIIFSGDRSAIKEQAANEAMQMALIAAQ